MGPTVAPLWSGHGRSRLAHIAIVIMLADNGLVAVLTAGPADRFIALVAPTGI
jgi:hypothetical protein